MDNSESEAVKCENLSLASFPNDSQKVLLITIVEAHITCNFQFLKAGKMDLYIVVESDGKSNYLDTNFSVTDQKCPFYAQTPTAWNAHQFPVWNYACPNFPLVPSDYGDKIAFHLWNDSTLPANKALCGYCSVTVRQLVENESSNFELSILHNKTNEVCGTLFINVKVSKDMGHVSVIDPNLFESPVQRLGVSGGTAPFFNLVLTEAGIANFQSENMRKILKTYYIGKDYSRASDEIAFYERAQSMKKNAKKNEEDKKTNDLLTFMFDYIGVLEASEQVDSDLIPRKMLVLQNLREGCKKLRLLDLKIGQKTAQAGWHGKTPLKAFKQSLLDKLTNSRYEGYRLEGFDGMPAALLSMNPLLETYGKFGIKAEAWVGDAKAEKTSRRMLLHTKAEKKSRRMMLQKMTATEIFMHFIDLHEEKILSNEVESLSLHDIFSSAEQSEIVLHEIVRQLFRLAVCCQRLVVPQKWIGSSVALGFDALARPERSKEGEEYLRSTVIVKIFDWGRSELLTKKEFDELTLEEQNDRERFWAYYKDAIHTLSFNAAFFYCSRFSVSYWDEVTVCVFDYDALTSDDFIGEVTLPLQTTKMATYQLKGPHDRYCGSLCLSLSWSEAACSRLKGTWKVHIDNATNLPAMNLASSLSDPYCLVIGKSNVSFLEFRQITSVKANTLDPVWDEIIEIPVAANFNYLLDSLEAEGLDTSSIGCKDSELFDISSSASYDICLQKWAEAIKNTKS
jgi:hypothetical protein